MIKYNEDMENINNGFTESVSDAVFEGQHSSFYLYDSIAAGPDEDEEEDDDEDSSDGSSENDPPLDDDVVHSPLPPQTGGKPGTLQP